MFRAVVVGRPNVGKSTLFNRLCGLRKAIVGDEPGITRDLIVGFAVWQSKQMEILDTGGILPGVTDEIPAKVLQQVEQAVERAHLLLLVVDGRAGITPLDEQLLPLLRRSGKPVWVLVNKIDGPELEVEAAAFYAFGFERVMPISAEHNRGIGDLLEAMASRVPEGMAAAEAELEEIPIAVVGRPNVGKSSLVNRMLGRERSIVSEVPGTTRDSVDTILQREGYRYRIIDTAGIRRKGKTDARTEKISVIMARKNLQHATVALLVLDAVEGVTKLDAAIGGYAESSGSSIIIVLNKWDLVEQPERAFELLGQSIRRQMKYLAYAPMITLSALTGQRVSKLFELIHRAEAGRRIRIPTGQLNNRFLQDLVRTLNQRNPEKGLRVRYITQARSIPPTFVVFTSGSKPLHFSTKRFIVNRLREEYGFFASPIRLVHRPGKSRN